MKVKKVLLLIFIVCISLCANNVFAAPKFTSKFFIIKDVGDVPNITVSYQTEDDYTKVILSSSNVQLHSLSGWTLSTDKYSLSKNYYDSADANTVSVCDNDSNCVDVNINELTIKKQRVSFPSLDVSRPFSNGTYSLQATTDGDGQIIYKSSNENVAVVDGNGTVTFKKIGRVDISAVAQKTNNYYLGTAFYTLRITKDSQSLDFEQTQVNKKFGDNSFTIEANHSIGNGDVLYASSKEEVASVNDVGTVTINGVGSTTITATATETDAFSSTTASYTLNVVPNAQVLRFDESSIDKKYGDSDFNIEVTQVSGNGNISFSSNDESVATVDNYGTVTIRGVGTAIITATASSTSNYDESSASYSLNVSKGDQIVELDNDLDEEITKKIGDEKFSLNAHLNVGNGEITYTSSNENVATVDEDGFVTILSPGETLLSVNVSETNNYSGTVKSMLLRVNSVESQEVLEGIPNTAKKIPFKTIRYIFSVFLILLGTTYIIRKKSLFEK